MCTLKNRPPFQNTTDTQNIDVPQHTEGIKYCSYSSDIIMEYWMLSLLWGEKKGATPKHYMIRQVYDSSSSTMGYTRACCWDKQRKTKNPHRSQRGISSVCARACVCLCARASSSAHVLLSLIIVCIHHNKQLHNSALQNKRTTLRMLKNKWPYKWWTRQTLRGYHSVGSPLICFHTWHCVKQVHRMWKTAQKKKKKKGTKTFTRVDLVLHKAIFPPKGLRYGTRQHHNHDGCDT